MWKRTWTREEDILILKHYLKLRPKEYSEIPSLIQEFQDNGFNRTKGALVMRISNFKFLFTGEGLEHISPVSQEVYDDYISGKLII